GVLLGIAAVSGVTWQLFPAFRLVSLIAATFLMVLSFLQMFGQIQRYDKRWFACRAVAESVKVQMWRFMMKFIPYQDPDTSVAVEQFVADVHQMLNEQQDAKLLAGSKPIKGEEVSELMLQERDKPVAERREFYLKGRIQDQKEWYSK